MFLALPEAASAELAPTLLERGVRVIDLSGAFRIRGDADRQRWYPATAALPDGTVYGMTEGHQDAIRQARLVSNPGCYPTAALLALEPLAAAGLLDGRGRRGREVGHLGRRQDAVAIARTSRKTTAASRRTASSRIGTPRRSSRSSGAPVTFVPHLVPLDRGILETIYGSLTPGTTEAQVADALHAAYADAPFVRLTGGALPEIKHVAHTNFCDIGWKVDAERGRIVLVAVIDNLVKGAAGSGGAEPQRRCSASTSGRACCEDASRPRLVLKLGGELLEQPQDLERVAAAIARLAARVVAGRRARRRQGDRRGAGDGGHSRSSRSTACASPTRRRSTSSSRCWPARSTRGSSRRCGGRAASRSD